MTHPAENGLPPCGCSDGTGMHEVTCDLWPEIYGRPAENDAPAGRTDYETRLGEHYDPALVDPVFGTRDCPATHPVTGRPCVYPEGHYDHHWAMGERRMQMFGPDLACPIPPAETEGGNA